MEVPATRQRRGARSRLRGRSPTGTTGSPRPAPGRFPHPRRPARPPPDQLSALGQDPRLHGPVAGHRDRSPEAIAPRPAPLDLQGAARVLANHQTHGLPQSPRCLDGDEDIRRLAATRREGRDRRHRVEPGAPEREGRRHEPHGRGGEQLQRHAPHHGDRGHGKGTARPPMGDAAVEARDGREPDHHQRPGRVLGRPGGGEDVEGQREPDGVLRQPDGGPPRRVAEPDGSPLHLASPRGRKDDEERHGAEARRQHERRTDPVHALPPEDGEPHPSRERQPGHDPGVQPGPGSDDTWGQERRGRNRAIRDPRTPRDPACRGA